MLFSVVVLPEPEPPTTATKVPDGMARLTSRTAKLRPPSNDFDTRSRRMSGTDSRTGSWSSLTLVLTVACAGPEGLPARRLTEF